MTNTNSTLTRLAFLGGLLSCWCTPLHDLDKAASARGGAAGGATEASLPAVDGGTAGATGGTGGVSAPPASGSDAAVDAGNGSDANGTSSAGTRAGAGGSSTRAVAGAGGRSIGSGGVGGRPTSTKPADGGAADKPGSAGADGGITPAGGTSGGAGAPGSGGAGGTAGLIAPDLPDIDNSPVQGQLTYSAGAFWDIDGSQWSAFEIHTPTANYWLVKSAAAIVSITDASGVQWINFSSGFRPNRGVPNLGGCCEPGDPTKLGLPMMSTEIDPSFTVTSTHLRLISKSGNSLYWLVWDFFLTHFTLTINRAEEPFGFSFRGVSGGALDPADQLVLSSGASRSTLTPYSGDLPGPVEWVYFTNAAGKHSLFLIQHADDTLADTYQIADGDTAMWTFGGGHITQTPIRFSLGIVGSSDNSLVTERIGFVRDAIH